VLRVKECTPTPSSSIHFIFRFAFESFKECGDVLGTNFKGEMFAEHYCQRHEEALKKKLKYKFKLNFQTKNKTKLRDSKIKT
jgi:hypothetical protein